MISLSSRFTFIVRYCRSLINHSSGRFKRDCKMTEIFCTAKALGINKYPKGSKLIEYGTAGFRDKATELPHVMYRMGLLAVLRSKANDGKTVGLMITASHNPEEDNGVKLCDPDGAMLNKDWESLATELINYEDDNLHEILSKILNSNNIDYDIPANVYLGRDTRSSSGALLGAALDGVHALGGLAADFGLLTTPQLHFVVCCKNYSYYGTPTLEGYYNKISSAFESLCSNSKAEKYGPVVYLDGANGVGAFKMKEMQQYLKSLNVEIFNDGTKGILNHKCGADFVKIAQSFPEGCAPTPGKRYASFDGDADRLVYYYMDGNNTFRLLDGDKIATLFAKFLKDLVQEAGLKFDMRVIQTAYANTSSTSYIEKVLKIPVVCTPTGVKHLHHEAGKYDISVYFEANGHGTIIFSMNSKQEIREVASKVSLGAQQHIAAKKLLSAIDVINETVGDAISDLLFTEAILQNYDWDIEDWDALYCDLPCRQIKVKIPDRTAVTTTDADRKCVTPEGLQTAIDTAVSNYKDGRCFVRPSGTEDVIRVYAEGATKEEVDKLAEDVSLLVQKFTSAS